MAVAQRDHRVYYLREPRMDCGLSVAGERYHVERLPFRLHVGEPGLEVGLHLFGRGESGLARPLGVVARLAVDAVERAHLAVGREQVHSQRHPEAAAAHGAEYCGMEEYGLVFCHCVSSLWSAKIGILYGKNAVMRRDILIIGDN